MSRTKLKLTAPNKLKILAFGDSLTEGYTIMGMGFHPYALELHKRLTQLLPEYTVTVDENGESGDRVLPSLSGRFFERIQYSCPLPTPQAAKYDLVIVLGGTNDLAYLQANDAAFDLIFDGLKKCYDQVLRTGASLLCLTVPERAIDHSISDLAGRAREHRMKLNQKITEFVKDKQGSDEGNSRAGVFLMDLAAIAPFPSPEDVDNKAPTSKNWSPDGLHMTPEGYDFVGQELAGAIYGLL